MLARVGTFSRGSSIAGRKVRDDAHQSISFTTSSSVPSDRETRPSNHPFFFRSTRRPSSPSPLRVVILQVQHRGKANQHHALKWEKARTIEKPEPFELTRRPTYPTHPALPTPPHHTQTTTGYSSIHPSPFAVEQQQHHQHQPQKIKRPHTHTI
jgi:hypothetical protein